MEALDQCLDGHLRAPGPEYARQIAAGFFAKAAANGGQGYFHPGKNTPYKTQGVQWFFNYIQGYSHPSPLIKTGGENSPF